nr:MAG TPA: hypothetical protein [Caudoviricetes sp.]
MPSFAIIRLTLVNIRDGVITNEGMAPLSVLTLAFVSNFWCRILRHQEQPYLKVRLYPDRTIRSESSVYWFFLAYISSNVGFCQVLGLP